MKKKILIILIIVLLLTSCGASWEQTKKTLKSDYGGGLYRKVTVTNQLTGEIVWEYEGKSYIDDSSKAGDITVIYYDKTGESKKADFIGQFYGVRTIEL
jgi:PBP1b-binding outer membrane lipoprotein LpoB